MSELAYTERLQRIIREMARRYAAVIGPREHNHMRRELPYQVTDAGYEFLQRPDIAGILDNEDTEEPEHFRAFCGLLWAFKEAGQAGNAELAARIQAAIGVFYEIFPACDAYARTIWPREDRPAPADTSAS